MTSGRKRVVIIGGGFAGAAAARGLSTNLDPSWEVVLISRDNFITFNPLLPEVVGASITPVHAVAPLRQMAPKARQMMVEVTDIDIDAKTLGYLGEGEGTLSFDHLVIACGNSANLDLVPGMDRYALPLKTIGDALFVRNRLMARLEQADIQANEMQRRWLLSFVVVGGGFSGVEVAGEIHDFVTAALRFYPNVKPSDISVSLIHRGEQILPELPTRLGDRAYEMMSKAGIDVRLRAQVESADDRGVSYRDEQDNIVKIAAANVICTIGTATNPLVEALPLPKERGRIKTGSDFLVENSSHIWAIGDCAAVPDGASGKISPPTAQCAEQQGHRLAAILAARLRNQSLSPFAFKPVGLLSTVGHKRAVAQMLGLPLSGLFAFLLWRAVYLIKIPTFSRKARIFLEWSWGLLFPQDIAYIKYTRTHRRNHSNEN